MKEEVTRAVQPVTPGETLEEEFLKPLGLRKCRLAKDMGVWAQRIGEIVAGKRAVTADTDLRLFRYFGLSEGWCLRGQAAYDIAVARQALQKELATIERCSRLASSDPPSAGRFFISVRCRLTRMPFLSESEKLISTRFLVPA